MKPASLTPTAQLFVCTNARDVSDPLRSGCGAHGPRVYQSLKRSVASLGRARDVWVTRTLCLGHCPAVGCAVAIEPRGTQWVEVTESDVDTLLRDAVTGAKTR